MKKTLPIAFSSGIIASIWVTSSTNFNMATFAGFLAWSTFFASGAGLKGLYKTIFSNFTGLLWGLAITSLTTVLTPMLGLSISMGLATAIGSFMVIIQNKLIKFSYIPGVFIGISTFFISENFLLTVLSMVLGAILGIISEKLSFYLEKNKIFE